MNLEAVNELIEKNPKLAASRAKLEQMQPGRYCVHRGWGFGMIKEYRSSENRLIIDFESRQGHSMDPAFCLNTLEILPDHHLLVRQQTEPDLIQEMVAKRPADLVVEVLQTYPNHAATAQEIENLFRDLLGEHRFRRWWTSAKKALAKDPRVSVPARKTECFYIREEPLEIEQEIFESFHETQSAKRRIHLVEELLKQSKFDARWRGQMEEVLQVLASTLADSHQISTSERLHGAWMRDELAQRLGLDPDGMEPSTASMLAETRNVSGIAEELPVNQQRRLLDLLKKTHPADWKDLTFSLLKDSKGKFTTECVNFLMENDLEEEIAATLSRWLTEQNLRAAVLHWIVKNRSSRRYSHLLKPLIRPRLLNAVFYAIDYEALQTAGSRKIPLADILSDDKKLISDLLEGADNETARDLANNLMLNQGFEELTKKALLARFIKKFPSVQSLVSGESETKQERLVVSRESYNRRKEEYDTIVSKKIPEVSKAIGQAREHGDLRENSEYKMAKQEQAVLLAKKELLEKELARAQVTDFADASTSRISIGSVAGLRLVSTGEKTDYTILGAWDSNPEKHVLSYQTPLARSLLNKRVGEEVTIRVAGNEETWVVESIGRYVDQSG